MKKTIFLLVMIIFWYSSFGQKVYLHTEVKGEPTFINEKTSQRPVLLYFMSGFDDSVCVYYNKKLILSSFIPSVSTLGHEYGISPLKLKYNDYKRSHLLEFKFIKSNKIYYVNLVRGYLCALVYLSDGQNLVLFTNKSPMLE